MKRLFNLSVTPIISLSIFCIHCFVKTIWHKLQKNIRRLEIPTNRQGRFKQPSIFSSVPAFIFIIYSTCNIISHININQYVDTKQKSKRQSPCDHLSRSFFSLLMIECLELAVASNLSVKGGATPLDSETSWLLFCVPELPLIVDVYRQLWYIEMGKTFEWIVASKVIWCNQMDTARLAGILKGEDKRLYWQLNWFIWVEWNVIIKK